jgi:hypothetical protein
MVPAVVDYARDRCCDFLIAEDYDSAAEMDQAVDILLASLQSERPQSDVSRSLQRRLEQANAQSERIVQTWDERIAEFRMKAGKAFEEMEKRHSEELERLKEEWTQPKALEPFSKPSPALLQLRRQQKSLAIVRNYAVAKELKEECERMMKEEAVAGGMRASETMKAEFAMLKERHQREIEGFQEHEKACIIKMEARKDRELRANENLKKQLHLKVLAAQRPGIVTPQLKKSLRKSDGTIRKLVTYKKASEGVRVPVQLPVLEPRRPVTRRSLG